jgi:hypothetical protein
MGRHLKVLYVVLLMAATGAALGGAGQALPPSKVFLFGGAG